MNRITAKPAEILPGILTRIAIAKYRTSVALSVHRLSIRIEQMPYRISNMPPLTNREAL